MMTHADLESEYEQDRADLVATAREWAQELTRPP